MDDTGGARAPGPHREELLMMRRSLLTLLATLAPVLFTACDDATGANGTSTLALYLTDAAGEVEHAWVTIDQIELVGEGMGVISVSLPHR
jgi:hypothetical protein